MATLMTRCVTLVLLVIPLLVTVNCRPQADEDDFIYGYAEDNDVNPQLQRREPFSDDVNKVLALLTNLRSYHRLRKHLSDVIPGSSDVVKVPVELRKRQPPCYWNLVSCYR